MKQDITVRLTDKIAKGNIKCNMEGMPFTDALDILVDMLSRHVGGFDKQTAMNEVLAREALDSTVIAPGLALPHARLDALDHPLVAIGTSPEGFVTDANRGPVNVIVLILTPRSDPSAYLRLLTAVSKSLGNESFRRRLLICNSSEEIYTLLKEDGVSVPEHLRAKDMMDPNPVTLSESDSLATVIDTLCRKRVMDIPIVDEEGDIRGVVSQEDLLKLSLPEHFLWMEDLSPILDFEPFADTIKKERETNVADFMREEYQAIAPDTPAIQLAKLFQTNHCRQIIVLEDSHFVGVVNLQSFVSQLFWM